MLLSGKLFHTKALISKAIMKPRMCALFIAIFDFNRTPKWRILIQVRSGVLGTKTPDPLDCAEYAKANLVLRNGRRSR
jgi:hypothetical protein